MSSRAERRARQKARGKVLEDMKASREERLRRRMQRGDSALVHGVCRECSRRRILIQPARLCERCLMRAVQPAAGPTPEQQLQYLHDLDACMDCQNNDAFEIVGTSFECQCACHEEAEDVG